jgi:hypothetical protein
MSRSLDGLYYSSDIIKVIKQERTRNVRAVYMEKWHVPDINQNTRREGRLKNEKLSLYLTI